MIQRMFEHLPYKMACCIPTHVRSDGFGYTHYVRFGLCISNYNIYSHIIMKPSMLDMAGGRDSRYVKQPKSCLYLVA